jgi:hypothetical protein
MGLVLHSGRSGKLIEVVCAPVLVRTGGAVGIASLPSRRVATSGLSVQLVRDPQMRDGRTQSALGSAIRAAQIASGHSPSRKGHACQSNLIGRQPVRRAYWPLEGGRDAAEHRTLGNTGPWGTPAGVRRGAKGCDILFVCGLGPRPQTKHWDKT